MPKPNATEVGRAKTQEVSSGSSIIFLRSIHCLCVTRQETGRKFGSLTNAIADATYDTQRDDRNELNGAASINFNIIDGLTFENRLGVQYYNNKYVSRGNKYYGGSASQNGSIYNRRT